MTDETFPHEIWAVHWNTEGAVMNGAWADTIRHFGGGVEYLRADHVDALLKAEREKALREAAEKVADLYGEYSEGVPYCDRDEAVAVIEALISEDQTNE